MIYNYNKTISAKQLDNEIRASSIKIALDRVDIVGSDAIIYFKASLDVDDAVILDALVEAHIPVPETSPIQKVSIDEFSLTATDKLPKFAAYEPEGDATTIVTHDFTDKCSWYQGSIQVVDGVLDNTAENTYKYSDKTHWIDLKNGRLYDEDSVMLASENLYLPKVYVDDVLQNESNYEINYPAGTVTFNSPVNGVVKASFHYADKSWYILKPRTGKVLSIKTAEVQFTSEVNLASPFIFEPWVNHPQAGLIPVPGGAISYKNAKDFMSACNGGQGKIEPWGGITHPTYVFPFDYARPKALKFSQGVEIRVYVKDHQEVQGEYATATFYVTVAPET